MSDGPEARIRGGSPTHEEEAAVLAAVDRIWAEERAKAAAANGPSGWVTAARLEATRRSANAVRGAWCARLAIEWNCGMGPPDADTDRPRGRQVRLFT